MNTINISLTKKKQTEYKLKNEFGLFLNYNIIIKYIIIIFLFRPNLNIVCFYVFNISDYNLFMHQLHMFFKRRTSIK